MVASRRSAACRAQAAEASRTARTSAAINLLRSSRNMWRALGPLASDKVLKNSHAGYAFEDFDEGGTSRFP